MFSGPQRWKNERESITIPERSLLATRTWNTEIRSCRAARSRRASPARSGTCLRRRYTCGICRNSWGLTSDGRDCQPGL